MLIWRRFRNFVWLLYICIEYLNHNGPYNSHIKYKFSTKDWIEIPEKWSNAIGGTKAGIIGQKSSLTLIYINNNNNIYNVAYSSSYDIYNLYTSIFINVLYRQLLYYIVVHNIRLVR